MVKLFRKDTTANRIVAPVRAAAEQPRPPGTALYVDTENLQGNTQTFVETVIERWPEGTPRPSRLNLYVQADRVALWDTWATSRFPGVTVTVRGIQHFSNRHSKNSADIAIAIDAIADFVTGVAQFVAVMSDDSDFIPLYVKLKDLNEENVPFLWLVTDRTRTRSTTIRDYFPNDYIHIVRIPQSAPEPSGRASTAPADAPAAREGGGDRPQRFAEMAELIIQEVPAGSFKSTECQAIIRSRWPNDPMATMTTPRFGTEFANEIWPILKERGVKLVNTKPRKYGLTSEVKATRTRSRSTVRTENGGP